MSTAETIFAVVAGVLLLLVMGNIAFSFIAERRNPPIDSFIECEGLGSITSSVVIPQLHA